MKTPAVLFLVFNRPEMTALVMDAIRAACPRRLYVAADGPRDLPGEPERCAKVRQIATTVDWPCEVKTLFRSNNLKGWKANREAITWFFENEISGIILEDDCIPDASFFRFCSELLSLYADDERIMTISGTNCLGDTYLTESSYFFSRFPLTWGWASWRRAWKLFDTAMARWPAFRDNGGLKAWADGLAGFEEYWKFIFDDLREEANIPAWDYAWIFSSWANNGLSCIPRRNVISNIGFGVNATHTTDAESWLANMPTYEMQFPLVHPLYCSRNVIADRLLQEIRFGFLPKTRAPWLKGWPRRIVSKAVHSSRHISK